MTKGPVFLTGFMGVGKTRVGRILARELGRCFLDTDRMIEQRAGKTIAEIFADEGEAHFPPARARLCPRNLPAPGCRGGFGWRSDHPRRQYRGCALRRDLSVSQGRCGDDFCPRQSPL